MLSWTVTSHIHTHTHKLSTLRLRYIYTFWHCISIYLSWQDIPHPGHPGDILMTSHQCHYPVSVAVTRHITVHHAYSVTAVWRVTHVTRHADVLCYGEMLSRVRPPDNCCYIAVVLVVCCGLGQDGCSHPHQPRTGMAIIYGLYLYKRSF